MGKRLYVGNLSYETTEDSIRSAFSKDGRNVAEVHIVTDRDTGRPRGFCFVEMTTDADAQAAIGTMDGSTIDGRNITVSEARERPARSGGGGGGGGHSGRGGDRW
jgi:RNA recognition motif-containing protein